MSNDITKQLEELKELSRMDFLDDGTKSEIENAISLMENIGSESTLNGGTKLPIKFINKSSNRNPEYATSGSAGFDFRAYLNQPVEIPGCNSGDNIKIIPTGLYFELPEGFELQVRPRSGMAAKHGITVLNSPGTVDCVPKGTLISTPNGDIRVEDLFNNSDKNVIYSFNEDKHELVEDVITDMWVVKDVEMVEIITEEGDTLRVPKTKEVFTNTGWVVASKLTPEHEILKIE